MLIADVECEGEVGTVRRFFPRSGGLLVTMSRHCRLRNAMLAGAGEEVWNGTRSLERVKIRDVVAGKGEPVVLIHGRFKHRDELGSSGDARSMAKELTRSWAHRHARRKLGQNRITDEAYGLA